VAVPAGPFPKGASTFVHLDGVRANLSRGYLFRAEIGFRLAANLTRGSLTLSRDGVEVGGSMPRYHATVFNLREMTLTEFRSAFRQLDWVFYSSLPLSSQAGGTVPSTDGFGSD
jgi:hypothetical protein